MLRRIRRFDSHALHIALCHVILVAIFEWARLTKILHRFGLIHGLSRVLTKLSLVGRLSPIKRNVGLGAAIKRPTLLHCAESAELDLDLLADHFCRGELFSFH